MMSFCRRSFQKLLTNRDVVKQMLYRNDGSIVTTKGICFTSHSPPILIKVAALLRQDESFLFVWYGYSPLL